MLKKSVSYSYATALNETEKDILENPYLQRHYGLAALDGGKKLLSQLVLPEEDMGLDDFDVANHTVSVCHGNIVAEYHLGEHFCYWTNYIFRSQKYFISFLPKEVVKLHQALQAANMLHVEFPPLYGNVVFRTNYAKAFFEENETFKNTIEFERIYHAFVRGENPSLLVNVHENVFTIRNCLKNGTVLHVVKTKERDMADEILQICADGKTTKYHIIPDEGLFIPEL